MIKVNQRIRELFPSVKLGILMVTGLDNTHLNILSSQLRATENKIREKYNLENLTSLPKIIDWREAYRKFGCKPSQFRSSIEALLRRVLQGKELSSINPIVDTYNIVSLETLLPIGADDLDHVEGNITLTIADGSELFVMLGKDSPDKIQPGEVIYKDDREVLCRAWNYRECEKTKITPTTTNCILVIEGLEHTTREEILIALERLKNLLQPFGKGRMESFLLPLNTHKCN